MLKEAFEYLAELAKNTKKDVLVTEHGDTILLQEPHRGVTRQYPIINVGDDAGCGTLDGFIAYANSLTEFYPYVRVSVDDQGLYVYATGGELGIKNLYIGTYLKQSFSWSTLQACDMESVAWWRRTFRNSQMNESVLCVHSVINELSTIEWDQSMKHVDADRSASKASYGSEIQQIVSTQKENALSDVQVSLNWFDDPRLEELKITCQCYWEFDHQTKRLCLVPRGKDIQQLKRLTKRAISEILNLELEHSIIFAGRRTIELERDPLISMDNPGDDDSDDI